MNQAKPEAIAAVRAAKNLKNWGPWAAFRYAQKRGASLQMYWTACLFEARRMRRTFASPV